MYLVFTLEDVPLVEFMYLVFTLEDVPLVEFMYLVLILHACQVRVTGGDSGLCCCVCVTSFERYLTPLSVATARALCASFCFRLQEMCKYFHLKT